MTSIKTMLALAALIPLSSVACDEGAEAPSDDGVAEVVLPGKADNYLSPTSREYRVWGMGEVTLEAEWAEQSAAALQAEVDRRLGYRFKAYAHFINQFVTDKSAHDDNDGYGEFAGLVRGSSLEFIVEQVDDQGLLWAFIWEVEMGGPRDMLERLPIERDDSGQAYFTVELPKLSQRDLEYTRYPRAFDPSTYTGETEALQVMIDPVEATPDSYPEYLRLADDGVIDVLVVVGGDYNDKRYDLLSAESHYGWLKKAGFSHPTSAWTELTLDSPPFEKVISMNGEDVRVLITLVHPDIVEDADLDDLRGVITKGYETADVVIYDGHAGQDPTYSGVVYHYNPRHAIAANALADLALPDKYQVYVFNGCKTYGAYPEAVYKSAAKDYGNLDVVSTVSFSWLSQQTFTTSGLLTELLSLDSRRHDPRTWRELLTRINKHSNSNVYYGVHGIEDNPHLNPYADADSLCTSCGRHNDCPGQGNMCVGMRGGSICTAECTADDGCPDGYICGDIAVGGRVTDHQCVPAGYTCQ
ncbi:MAG: hypothetical protein CSA66_05105 [Proteobacteria bacterium]|nr:MAG: hypothetical protein CSA66_05105 [Pseudomonadota bacterium]